MYDYELVAIVNPEASDEAVAGKIDGVSQLIAEREGVVEESERLGKRRLAYPIKKHVEGTYALLRFKLEPSHIAMLRDTLERDEDVLRYLVIKRGK
jgi:small subunit ribosomal protein S6